MARSNPSTRSARSSPARPALPILGSPPRKVRPSKISRWRAAVLIGIHLLVALHIAHWLASGSTLTPVEPSEAIELGRRGVVNFGLLFFAATILLTALFGRFFCGWGCHLVALQDLCRWLLARVGIRPRPLGSRLLVWVPALAFVYMFLWPWIYRLVKGRPLQAIRWELTTPDFWATFPGWIVGGMTFFVCGFVAVYLLGAKGFCTYGCPYGAIFGAVDRLAPFRIRVTDACSHCGHCTSVCTSNVRVHEEVRDYGMVVDPGCMKCLDCVSVCPQGALFWGPGRPSLFASTRVEAPTPRHRTALSVGEEVLLGLAFAAAFFTFRGLYDRLPFLFSLGLAGVLAYLALLGWRLVTRTDLHLRSRVLRRRGRLTPAGRWIGALLVLVALLWGHSAVIRTLQARGATAYGLALPLRQKLLQMEDGPVELPTAELRRMQLGQRQLERVRSWGLVAAPRSLTQLAWLQTVLASGEPERTVDEALRAGGSAAELHLLLGHLRLRRGDFSGALEEWDESLAADSARAAAYLAKGTALARKGRFSDAELVFSQGLGRFGPDPTLLYNAALARALQGDSEGAISLFEAVLELEPGHLAARENLAGLLAGKDRHEESVEHYRRALDENPTDAETWGRLARVLLALGRSEEARVALWESLRIDPDNPEYRRLLDIANRAESQP